MRRQAEMLCGSTQHRPLSQVQVRRSAGVLGSWESLYNCQNSTVVIWATTMERLNSLLGAGYRIAWVGNPSQDGILSKLCMNEHTAWERVQVPKHCTVI